MSSIRTKIIYFVLPILLLAGGIILIGSVKSVDADKLKGLSSQATTVSLDPPDDLNFAGEIVPVQDFDVQERLDKELIRYIYYHSATIMNIKRAARWKDEITKILKDNRIPTDFFYLCVAESHLTNATSPVGAKGFWQFMPETARMYGLEVSKVVDERYDPIKSTHAACAYLRDAHRMFKNWTLVAASYNMGMGGVRGQLNKQKVDNYYDLYLNKETAAYVFRILALKTILEKPAEYGFTISDDQLYKRIRYQKVTVDSSVTDLVEFAKQHGTTYKMLKVLNPWLLKDQLVVEAAAGEGGKTYEIKIPHDAELPEEAARDLVPDSAKIGILPGDTLAADSNTTETATAADSTKATSPADSTEN